MKYRVVTRGFNGERVEEIVEANTASWRGGTVIFYAGMNNIDRVMTYSLASLVSVEPIKEKENA